MAIEGPQLRNIQPAALPRVAAAFLVVFAVIHAGSGLYHLVVAFVYFVLPTIPLGYNVQIYQLTMDFRYLNFLVLFHVALLLLHLVGLYHVCTYRRQRRSRQIRPMEHERSTSQLQVQRPTRWQRLKAIWSSHLSVKVPGYVYLFLGRELLETVLQTEKAYQMSRYVPRTWLNNLFVFNLVCSCFSLSIAKVLAPHSPTHQFVWCLVLDILLDFFSVVGVPTILALYYLADYDFELNNFPFRLLADSVWIVTMMNEFELIFIQDWADLTARALIAGGLTLSIRNARKILLDPAFAQDAPDACGGTLVVVKARPMRMGQWILGAWGVVVFLLHALAATAPEHPACEIPVRPWSMSPTIGCSLMLINCSSYSPPMRGSVEEITEVLTQVNVEMLRVLMITQCPEMTMPPMIDELHSLFALRVFNSSLKWGLNSAVRRSMHPRLKHVLLLNVQLPLDAITATPSLPPGLMHPEFPPTLTDVHFIACNLSHLPSNLPSIWPKRMHVNLLANRFNELPRVLYDLDLMALSFRFNPIHALPRWAFEQRSLFGTAFDGCPIAQLPSDDDPPQVSPVLSDLGLERTLIPDLPQWMQSDEFLSPSRDVRLANSTFCLLVLNETIPRAPWHERVSCARSRF